MLDTVGGKLSKLKLKVFGSFDVGISNFDFDEIESERPKSPVTLLVDSKKSKIEAILGLSENPNIIIRQLTQNDAPVVLDFLTYSNQNHGPFAQAIRSKCDTVEKVKFELGPWSSLQKYHNVYFGCYLEDIVEKKEDIMIGGIVAGILPEQRLIEIGGLTRNSSKGKGFGTSSVLQIVGSLKRYIRENNIDIEQITSVVSDPDNQAARRMLEKAGFNYIKTGQDGVLYSYFLE